MVDEIFERLSIQVLERGWLSSNNVIFRPPDGVGRTAIVDTGFDVHASQTCALVRRALDGRPLDDLLNTHLHSDHAGGNAALQSEWPEVVTWVPHSSFDAASRWDHEALTYRQTGQPCRRFSVDRALLPGSSVSLGEAKWSVYAASGHDDDAIVLFEPVHRVLISGDALWQNRLAIVFPALTDPDRGFDSVEETLSMIEGLRPSVVIPGHGNPFFDVKAALDRSRSILQRLRAHPAAHDRHAVQSLIMFKLLGETTISRELFDHWVRTNSILGQLSARLRRENLDSVGREAVLALISKGVISEQDGYLSVTSQSSPSH